MNQEQKMNILGRSWSTGQSGSEGDREKLREQKQNASDTVNNLRANSETMATPSTRRSSDSPRVVFISQRYAAFMTPRIAVTTARKECKLTFSLVLSTAPSAEQKGEQNSFSSSFE